MPYYLLPILAFLTFLFDTRIRKNSAYKFFFFVFLLTISFVACFRGPGMGTDYWQYRGYYLAGWVPGYDIGFNIITYLIHLFGGSYQVFLSFFFLSALSLKLFVFKRLSYSAAISLMIISGFWFLVYDMNGIRQALSVSLIGLAAYFAYKEKFLYFFLFTLIAASVHFSSIIFLPFYFLLRTQLSRTPIFIFIAISYLINIFGLSDYIFNYLGSGSADSIFSEKSVAYSNIDVYDVNALFSFGMIHRMLIFFITLFFVKQIPASKKLQNFFLVAAFLNIIIYIMFSRYEIIATRLSLSYRFIECIFFSYLPFITKNRLYQIIIALILLVYVLSQIYITINIPNGNLLPYRSIFN